MSRGTLSLLYWIVMITSSRKFSQGSISAKHLDSDAMLRDMPMHDEAPCCSPSDESSQIPKSTLLELSQMTTADFMKQFGDPAVPDESVVVVQSETPVRANPPSLHRIAEMSFPIMEMEQPEFVPMENNLDLIKFQMDTKNNFRQSKILDIPAVEVVPVAENARCIPQDTLVALPKPVNHSLTIFPQCTILKQCGGCCGDAGLVCRASETRSIKRKASYLAVVSGRLKVVDNNVIVSLVEDVQCSCLCRQFADDCSANQSYEPGNCRCVCKNQALSTSCGPHRVWDSERCECRCPNSSGMCPTGFHFDSNYYCSCMMNTGTKQTKPPRSNAAAAASAVAVVRQQNTRRKARG